MKYGERLKLARKDAKMTQAALAEAAGLSQPTIHHLESETSEGSIYTPRLARLLKVSADWLADEIGEMRPMLYTTADPKIIAVAKLMQDLPEYGKDAAAKMLLRSRNSSKKPSMAATARTAKILHLPLQLRLNLD